VRKRTVRDIDVAGKLVLMRVDYNVPMDAASGRILDDKRIKATLPTLDYLRLEGARVVLLSHLGRPKGERDPRLSLAPVAARLAELMGEPVQTVGDCIGAEVQEAVAALADGEVLLLENVRFHPEEEANEKEFAKALASLGDVYVNDAFGVAHRAHASSSLAPSPPRTSCSSAPTSLKKPPSTLGCATSNPAAP